MKVDADKVSIARCGTCRQLVDSLDTVRYEGHPSLGAVEESTWMTDPSCLSTKMGISVVEDSMPQ